MINVRPEIHNAALFRTSAADDARFTWDRRILTYQVNLKANPVLRLFQHISHFFRFLLGCDLDEKKIIENLQNHFQFSELTESDRTAIKVYINLLIVSNAKHSVITEYLLKYFKATIHTVGLSTDKMPTTRLSTEDLLNVYIEQLHIIELLIHYSNPAQKAEWRTRKEILEIAIAKKYIEFFSERGTTSSHLEKALNCLKLLCDANVGDSSIQECLILIRNRLNVSFSDQIHSTNAKLFKILHKNITEAKSNLTNLLSQSKFDLFPTYLQILIDSKIPHSEIQPFLENYYLQLAVSIPTNAFEAVQACRTNLAPVDTILGWVGSYPELVKRWTLVRTELHEGEKALEIQLQKAEEQLIPSNIALQIDELTFQLSEIEKDLQIAPTAGQTLEERLEIVKKTSKVKMEATSAGLATKSMIAAGIASNINSLKERMDLNIIRMKNQTNILTFFTPKIRAAFNSIARKNSHVTIKTEGLEQVEKALDNLEKNKNVTENENLVANLRSAIAQLESDYKELIPTPSQQRTDLLKAYLRTVNHEEKKSYADQFNKLYKLAWIKQHDNDKDWKELSEEELNLLAPDLIRSEKEKHPSSENKIDSATTIYELKIIEAELAKFPGYLDHLPTTDEYQKGIHNLNEEIAGQRNRLDQLNSSLSVATNDELTAHQTVLEMRKIDDRINSLNSEFAKIHMNFIAGSQREIGEFAIAYILNAQSSRPKEQITKANLIPEIVKILYEKGVIIGSKDEKNKLFNTKLLECLSNAFNETVC